MVREIVKDKNQLMQKAVDATKNDLHIIDDLIDTAKAKEGFCVGLAANMIGENIRIIVVKGKKNFIPMVNPKIIRHSQSTYEAEEACLSHEGTKKTTRYSSIEVEFYDRRFKKIKQNYNGFAAEIIQHELDHCEGILI